MASDVNIRLLHLERELRLMRKDIRLLTRELREEWKLALGETNAHIEAHLDAHHTDPEMASVPQFIERHRLAVTLVCVGLLSVLLQTAQPWAVQLLRQLH